MRRFIKEKQSLAAFSVLFASVLSVLWFFTMISLIVDWEFKPTELRWTGILITLSWLYWTQAKYYWEEEYDLKDK